MATARTRSQHRVLGNFEILREIGEGGMGVIYLARQPALERLVVLKKMRRELLVDPAMTERFQREAQAAGAVHHHNVVAVYDCFEAKGDHYIAQELVDGIDLGALIERVGKLEPRIAALVALEVVRGLEEIHSQGIVHRDIKPSNVLIGNAGEVKVADFGIALGRGIALTRPGTMVGSVPYMSPEQMLGEPVDHRSDLFSFGILLYEMLVGEPPFEESSDDAVDTLLERIHANRYDSPRKRGARVPRYLVRLIRRCLRARPGSRLASATHVRRRLERRLRRVSPADGRQRIAAFLHTHEIIERIPERTMVRPIGPRAPTWRRLARRGAPVAAAIVVVSLVAFATLRRDGDGPVASEPAEQVAPVMAGSGPAEDRPAATDPAPRPVAVPPPQPALVRFVAYPWAEVRVGEEERFLTPRAAAVSLPPGRHTVTFAHPTFGTAEYELDLAAGERRIVQHRYAEAAAP